MFEKLEEVEKRYEELTKMISNIKSIRMAKINEGTCKHRRYSIKI